MNNLNPPRKPVARMRSGGLLALLLLAGWLALVTPLRADNPPTYLFQIDSSAVPGGFQPNSVALDSSNNIYVSDTLNNRILKFTGNGNYLTQWGSLGTGNGQFQYPQGVALDSSNNVYAVDDDNDRVEKFDSNGNYLTQWGGEGTGDGQFQYPQGVAVDSRRYVYVVDAGNSRIEKFSFSGANLNKWGSADSGNGQFDNPAGIAVDSSNNVYVADGSNDRVEKFDSNGNYLTQWGSAGNGNGQFGGTYGIAVDSSNSVYVTDLVNARVQKFDSNGNYLTQWGSVGTGDGQFGDPFGIAVDSTGNFIYVADNSDRIEVFVNNPNIVAPIITNQPVSQTVPAAANVTFSVGVAGAAPFAYQWNSNNVPLIGATNAAFTLTNVGFADSASYSVLVTNSYGSELSSNAVLTLLSAVVMTQPASSISATGAVLNGSVTVSSDETAAWFEWGTDTNYGNIAGETIIPGDNSSNNISSTLSGLVGNIYHYRIDAANDFGIVYGNDVSFTVGFAPTATTLLAVNSTNGVTLNAMVNPEGWDTTVYFKWGVQPYVTNTTPAIDVGEDAMPLNVTNLITSLSPARQYYYEVAASNSLGTTLGALIPFLSPPFTSIPPGGWQSVASSADGTKLVAGGALYISSTNFVYTSTNSGATWTPVSLPSRVGKAEAVASSADGTELVAGFGFASDLLYISTNSGVIWGQITNVPVATWNSVASSADGTKLAAAALNLPAGIYTSTNSGVSWTHQTNGLLPNTDFIYIASSADGSKLVTASGWTGIGPIFTSTNSGVNWTRATNAPVASWYSVASSADGNRLMACAEHGNVYVSTNAGAIWTKTSLPTNNWNSVAESADGSKMVALANSEIQTIGLGSGGIYTSTDSGATWVSNNVPNAEWTTAAISADGNEIIATTGNTSTPGGIYVSQTTPSPVLNLSGPDNVISWIIPSLDFTLQQSPDLMNWTDVTNPPALNLTNLQNQVALPPFNGNGFFRLMH